MPNGPGPGGVPARDGRRQAGRAGSFQRSRDIVAGAHHITDLEARRDLHVHAGRLISGWLIEIVRTHARVARDVVAFLILRAGVLGDGRNLISLSARLAGVTVKVADCCCPSAATENSPVRGSTRQPAGTSSRMLPFAGPLTLLLTTAVTGNDFASSGTTPARGAICTPIAGPTTSGSVHAAHARHALHGLHVLARPGWARRRSEYPPNAATG